MIKPEKPERAYRQRPKAALSAGAERIFCSPRTDSDQVSIEFDWEVPASAGDPIIFLAAIVRGGRESSIRFAIDLQRLQSVELERFHDFLAGYQARTVTHYELAWHLSWLLETWLIQTQSELACEELHAKVRQLLLVESSFAGKQEIRTSKS
jgi:hypothetical protein